MKLWRKWVDEDRNNDYRSTAQRCSDWACVTRHQSRPSSSQMVTPGAQMASVCGRDYCHVQWKRFYLLNTVQCPRTALQTKRLATYNAPLCRVQGFRCGLCQCL